MIVQFCTSSRLFNDRVNRFHATAAPRGVPRRRRCEGAATARGSLYRGASPRLVAAPPAMLGSPPATGDRRAAEAGSPRGLDGSRQVAGVTEARVRVPLR